MSESRQPGQGADFAEKTVRLVDDIVRSVCERLSGMNIPPIVQAAFLRALSRRAAAVAETMETELSKEQSNGR